MTRPKGTEQDDKSFTSGLSLLRRFNCGQLGPTQTVLGVQEFNAPD